MSARRRSFDRPVWVLFTALLAANLRRTKRACAEALASTRAEQELLRTVTDAMLDPQVLLEAVRDPAGRVIDFVYRSVNRAACSYLGLKEEELVGHRQQTIMPNLKRSGLQERYIQCLEDGQPLILNDFTLLNEILDETRRYDIRAARAGSDLLRVTWSDVTERFRAAEQLAASETTYRLLVENSGDAVLHIRHDDTVGDKVVWVSPNIEARLGLPTEYWLGRGLLDVVPAEDREAYAARWKKIEEGGDFKGRMRIKAADGDVHWWHVYAKPFCDAAGHRDGSVVSIRVGDDEVAAEQAVEQARHHRARADALYRRSMDSAAVGMCLADLEGNFIEVNAALCEFFGYDAETLKHKTWQELTAPDFLQADLDKRDAILAGDIESYRMVKQYTHADGRLIWGDLSLSSVRDADGQVELFIGQIADVTAEVEMREQLEEARRNEAAAAALYRRSVESAAVGMCLIDIEGRFIEVNDAVCEFFGYDAETLKQKTWQELTAPDYLQADLDKVDDLLEGRLESYRMAKQYIHADGHLIWGDLSGSCIRDEHGRVERFIAQIIDMTQQVALTEQLQRQNDLIAASERTYRLLVENTGDIVCHLRENRIVWISPSVDAALGAPAETWLGRNLLEYVPPEDVSAGTAILRTVAEGGSVQERIRVVSPDGVAHWLDLHAKPFYDDDGHQDGVTTSLRVVDDKVAGEQALEEARRQQAISDARYRRSIDNAAVGMCLVTPAGYLHDVNNAMCQLFGYDAEEMNGTHWQDFTAPEYLETELDKYNGVLEGRIDSYRMVKRYHHADGHLIWGDLSVSGVRDDNGEVEYLIALVTDITARVRADERNRALAQQLQQQSDAIKAELDSAATYMSSIMPRGLCGPVVVSSRYLPSRELGGDCFDYTWIDDDHLIVYLIDVSGHGIEPALLAVSLQNMLRSGTLTAQTMLDPEATLTELNRLFQMEQQRDHYFTIWYGVYERPTRTLRYASAGAPPAFAFNATTGSALTATELTTKCKPVGTFEGTRFTAATYSVPPGCRILLFSDGASEIVLAGGRQLGLGGLKELITRLAGSPNWSLDDVIDQLRDLTPTGVFEDDCSLIQATFE